MNRTRIHVLLIALVLAAMGIAFLPHAAFAQAAVTVSNYTCNNGVVGGKLYDSGANCPTTLAMGNIFSFLVCNIEQLSSNLMGKMYCGMITQLAPAVYAAATLAVLFFGVSFMIGLTAATGREAIAFILKIIFVTTFATNADYIVGYAYALLIGGMQDGVSIVLKGLGGTYTSGSDVYGHLDQFLKSAIDYATDGIAYSDSTAMCKKAVFSVLAVMSAAFPMIFYLCLLLIARMVITFLRAVFAYIYAIVAITFLLTMSPFFVTFYLFKVTRSFFEKWVGYLVSFSVQVVLLFSFIAFIFMIDVTNLSSNLTNIMMFSAVTEEGTSLRLPWRYCTVCDFMVVDQNGLNLPSSDPDYLTKGKLVCKDTPPKPIEILHAIAPPDNADATKGTATNALLDFAKNGIISLLVLAFVVERLLHLLPSLAQTMASALGGGVYYAPQLGGGVSLRGGPVVNTPGDSLISDFARGYQGVNSGVNASRFHDKDGTRSIVGNSFDITQQGIKDGLSTMITGKNTQGVTPQDSQNPNAQENIGIAGRWENFFKDPTDNKQ